MALLPRPAALLLAAGALAAASCSSEEPGPRDVVAAPSIEVERDVRDLVTAITPLPATVPANERNEWYARRRATLERLRAGTREHGLEALRVYAERPDAVLEVRIGLLDVAAHTSPDEVRPILVDLVGDFGPDLGLRTAAASFLGTAAPETAIEVLEPILRGELRGRTYPPEERLLDGWNDAALALGIDRVPLLCLLATDLDREYDVRHRATKLLGEEPSAQGRQALEQLLVESSGDHMIRRFAAQSLHSTLPIDELCPLLQRTMERESDPAFQLFLDNFLLAYCR